MLHQIPFVIRGFHCDNGSEFINHQVAGMLEKLRVEFTKSRAYRTTDNALVEGKNGAVIRKHIRPWSDRRRARRSLPEVLHRAFESIPEFSPAMRVCDDPDRASRPPQAYLSVRRLPNALREADLAAEMGELLETGPGCRTITARIQKVVGYGGRQENAESENRFVGRLSRFEVIRCQSTAHGCRRLLSAEPREGGSIAAPFPWTPSQLTGPTLPERSIPKQPEASPPGSSRIGNKPPFQAHLVLESTSDSRLISGLENAEGVENFFFSFPAPPL